MRSQQRVKWARFRVACVSFVALLILGVLLWLVTGGEIFREHTHLYVYIPDATGIEPGSLVRVNGIVIGSVQSIALSGARDPVRIVRLTLKVDRDSLAMVPTGSYADLGIEDPAGDKFIDITSRGRGALTPNSEIPYRGPTDVFKTIDFEQFDENLRQMSAVLTDIENGRGLVGQFVQGTQMYSDLRRRLGDIENAIHKAASTSSALGQELYGDRLYRQVEAPILALDQSLAQLQAGQGALGQLLRESAQYEQAQATVRSLRDSIANIRQMSLIQSDELYTGLTRSVTSLIATVDAVNTGPLFAAPNSYETWTGMLKNMENTVRDFRQDPRKYLRLKVF